MVDGGISLVPRPYFGFLRSGSRAEKSGLSYHVFFMRILKGLVARFDVTILFLRVTR